jgi:hypothetical protein
LDSRREVDYKASILYAVCARLTLVDWRRLSDHDIALKNI